MLDEVDKKILSEVQKDIPLVKEPFKEIGKKIGISEEEVIKRLKRMVDSGIIRKFGLRIDSKKVGFASTLVAFKVPWSKIDEIAERLNKYESVTHNYARDHDYNLWITVIEKDEESLKKTLEEIKKEVGYEMIDLPVKRKFKIEVKFKL